MFASLCLLSCLSSPPLLLSDTSLAVALHRTLHGFTSQADGTISHKPSSILQLQPAAQQDVPLGRGHDAGDGSTSVPSASPKLPQQKVEKSPLILEEKRNPGQEAVFTYVFRDGDRAAVIKFLSLQRQVLLRRGKN